MIWTILFLFLLMMLTILMDFTYSIVKSRHIYICDQAIRMNSRHFWLCNRVINKVLFWPNHLYFKAFTGSSFYISCLKKFNWSTSMNYQITFEFYKKNCRVVYNKNLSKLHSLFLTEIFKFHYKPLFCKNIHHPSLLLSRYIQNCDSWSFLYTKILMNIYFIDLQ
jgi:hypothetical protein